MNYRFAKAYPDGLLVLPQEVLGKLEEAGEVELKILLHLACLLKNGEAEEEVLCAALAEEFSAAEILSALAFWRGCGILKTGERKKKPARVLPESEPAPAVSASPAPEAPAEKREERRVVIDADEAPFYTAADLARAAEKQPQFKALAEFAEARLEKVLNASELARLYSFLDYLKMPAEVVMLVMEDCVFHGKKSLRYITRVLTNLQDEGIDTYEAVEAHFARRDERNLYAAHVRRLFGLGERKLTRGEEEMLDTWRITFGYGEDMLDAAYERTVASAKNPSMKYMHRILESWHAQGITTPGEEPKKDSGKADKSYDLDDFFQKAVSKGRKDL